MADKQDFTAKQIQDMKNELSQDGYANISDWMQDNDYVYNKDDGKWYDEYGVGPYDPYTQYFWATSYYVD